MLSTSAMTMGVIDISTLNEIPLERIEMVANERVEAKQLGNTIETTFPWKDQIGLKVTYDMGEPTIGERFADKRNRKVITELVDVGDGGFKVDVLLNERPDTNRFCYSIEGAEDYDFFYQAALTDEAIKEGAERPDNVVGSYAVYHKTLKDNNYKTGKVMHIYRPEVWELNNEKDTREWAELSYDEREGLCVTARQGFLDNATYPVRIDPTFGYTSAGASTAVMAETFENDYQYFQRWGIDYSPKSAGNGDLLSVNAYMKIDTASSSDEQWAVKAVINEVNSVGTNSHGQIGLSTESIMLGDNVKRNVQFSITGNVSYGRNYVIQVIPDLTSEVHQFYEKMDLYFDDTIESFNQYYEYYDGTPYTGGQYSSPENPWLASSFSDQAQFSIYATYSSTSTAPQTILQGGVFGGGTIIQ